VGATQAPAAHPAAAPDSYDTETATESAVYVAPCHPSGTNPHPNYSLPPEGTTIEPGRVSLLLVAGTSPKEIEIQKDSIEFLAPAPRDGGPRWASASVPSGKEADRIRAYANNTCVEFAGYVDQDSSA
jgi:hypothetical protein